MRTAVESVLEVPAVGRLGNGSLLRAHVLAHGREQVAHASLCVLSLLDVWSFEFSPRGIGLRPSPLRGSNSSSSAASSRLSRSCRRTDFLTVTFEARPTSSVAVWV